MDERYWGIVWSRKKKVLSVANLTASHHQQNCTTVRRWWCLCCDKKRPHTFLCHCLTWWHERRRKCERAAWRSECWKIIGSVKDETSRWAECLDVLKKGFIHESPPVHLEWVKTSFPHVGVWRSRRDRKPPDRHRGGWQTGQMAVTWSTSLLHRSLVPPAGQKLKPHDLEQRLVIQAIN